MNISVMRKIDLYAGGAICLMLNLVERVRRVLGRSGIRPVPRSVLVTKYLGMGSILLATPALKNQHPDCRITMLTFAENGLSLFTIPHTRTPW